eukprot:486397-Hanusia_phi.AAC.2
MKLRQHSDRPDSHEDSILSSKAQEFCRQGRQEERRGNVERAEEYYRLALLADENHADTLAAYGHFLHTHTFDYDGAENMYKRSLRANPTHLDTLQNYAVFLEDVRGDMQRAEKLYNIALSMTAWCDMSPVEGKSSLDVPAQEEQAAPKVLNTSERKKERRLKKYQPLDAEFEFFRRAQVSSPFTENQSSGKQIDAERRFLDGSATFIDDSQFSSTRHDKRHVHNMHGKPWEGPLDNLQGSPQRAERTAKRNLDAITHFFYFGTPRSQLMQSKTFHHNLSVSFEYLRKLSSSKRLIPDILFDALENCGIFANRGLSAEKIIQLFQGGSTKCRSTNANDVFIAFSELVLDLMSMNSAKEVKPVGLPPQVEYAAAASEPPVAKPGIRNFARDWLRQVKEVRKEEENTLTAHSSLAESQPISFKRLMQHDQEFNMESLIYAQVGDNSMNENRRPTDEGSLPKALRMFQDDQFQNHEEFVYPKERKISELKQAGKITRAKGATTQAVSSIMPEERFDKESLYHPTNSFFSDMKNPHIVSSDFTKFSLLMPNEQPSVYQSHQEKDLHENGDCSSRSSQRRNTGEETARSNDADLRSKTGALLQRLRDKFGTAPQLFHYFKTRKVDTGLNTENISSRQFAKSAHSTTSITFEEFKATAESLGKVNDAVLACL